MRSFARLLGFVIAALAATVSAGTVAAAAPPAATGSRFEMDDFVRLADLSEPAMSSDGEYVVYTVSTANTELDKTQSDLWRVRWDGSDRQALTQTKDKSEWRASFSPDGRTLAFLADRGGDDATTQVWILPTGGGEARKLTDFAGGVEDYDWSPDGTQLAIVAADPERPPGVEKPKNPAPIVIDRYFFKEDGSDYLAGPRQHLYVFEVATGRVTQLASGGSDEYLPKWSPDGQLIAFVAKRGDDADRNLNYDLFVIEPRPGAVERRLTSFPGGDHDPSLGSRLSWSPDSRSLAYLQGGEDKWIYYAPWQLAVVDVATAESRIPANIDRWFYQPRWSPDGRSLLALIEESRVMNLSRIDPRSGRITKLTDGLRYDADYAIAKDGRIAVLGGDDRHPYTISALDGKELRVIADHNEFVRARQLGAVEPIRFQSADGTQIEGLLMKPVGYVSGKRYPTILRIHGGPVAQYNHEFMADAQAFAAQGYAVVAVNPRGSSGRGFDFARAIYADWGNKDVADVLAGVEHVVAMGVADPDRLGLGGHSYGGILTNYVIASDRRFKAATSSAGASNFIGMYGHDQYIREYEFEVGLPWKSADVYKKLSYPFLHADRITTPTSFYCNEKDFNVPCLGAEQMYQALRSLNVPTQLVIYPGENHTLTVPSYLRDRLQRYLAWYDRYLKGAPQGGR
jgi:dipeptidyl aminopeptidase/acylaminoacyl peptidase